MDADTTTTARQVGKLVLTIEETAAVLQVPPATVKNLHATRQLTGVLVGKHLRWRPRDVEQFVQSLGADRNG